MRISTGRVCIRERVASDDALDSGSKTKTSSAKYLLEKYYDPASSNKNHREAKRQKEEDKEKLIVMKEDKARLLKGLRN